MLKRPANGDYNENKPGLLYRITVYILYWNLKSYRFRLITAWC
jgi:hypothetical protein